MFHLQALLKRDDSGSISVEIELEVAIDSVLAQDACRALADLGELAWPSNVAMAPGVLNDELPSVCELYSQMAEALGDGFSASKSFCQLVQRRQNVRTLNIYMSTNLWQPHEIVAFYLRSLRNAHVHEPSDRPMLAAELPPALMQFVSSGEVRKLSDEVGRMRKEGNRTRMSIDATFSLQAPARSGRRLPLCLNFCGPRFLHHPKLVVSLAGGSKTFSRQSAFRLTGPTSLPLRPVSATRQRLLLGGPRLLKP